MFYRAVTSPLARRWALFSTVLAVALTTACDAPTGITEPPAFALTQAGSCFLIPEGLVSWWTAEGHFDDVVGDNHANDVSGVTFDDGVVGQGFKYTGQAGQFIEVPDAPSLRAPQFTMELWATKVGLGQADDHWGTLLFAKSATLDVWRPVPGSWFMTWRSAVDDRITATVIFEDDVPHYGRPPIRLVSANTFPLPSTIHAALSYDGSVARLYVNGVLEDEFDSGGRVINQGPGGLTFGDNPKWSRDIGYHHTHNGIFDEIGFFDRALSGDEIQAIYDAGAAGKAIDPARAIGSLLDEVASLELQRGLDNAFTATLRAAQNSVENDRPAAINQLEAFINQVEALRGKALSHEEADRLIARAWKIIETLVSCG